MLARVVFLAVLAVTLGACASDEKKPTRHCPQIAVVRTLDTVKDYGTEVPAEAALVATGRMMKIEDNKCSYQKRGVDVTWTLNLGALRGARLGGDKIGLPFFVALLASDDRVMSKELMTANFSFSGKDKTAAHSENLHVFIPLAPDEDAEPYRILMGFQLTEAQLKAQREAQP